MNFCSRPQDLDGHVTLCHGLHKGASFPRSPPYPYSSSSPYTQHHPVSFRTFSSHPPLFVVASLTSVRSHSVIHPADATPSHACSALLSFFGECIILPQSDPPPSLIHLPARRPHHIHQTTLIIHASLVCISHNSTVSEQRAPRFHKFRRSGRSTRFNTISNRRCFGPI